MNHIRQFLTVHPLTPEMDAELSFQMRTVINDTTNYFGNKYWWYMVNEDAPCGEGTMQDFIKQGLSGEDFSFDDDDLIAFNAMLPDCPITNAAFQEWMRNR